MKDTFDQLFKSDKETVEIPIGTNTKNEDVFLIVAEAGNEKHRKIQRKFAKALQNARFNEKRRTEIFAKICADALLVDWKGFIDENGASVEATYENKLEQLIKYEKLLTAVLEAATDEINFKEDFDPESEAATEKN